jgi:O-succinylbenzoate synthase
MSYQFTFRLVNRKFIHPLITNHGIWQNRESIILRLIDNKGRVGWGDISPISWFGSETLEQAVDFCQQLPKEITEETIFTIPDNLPACQFGFESAIENIGKKHEFISPQTHNYSGLLSAGKAALNQWTSLWNHGFRTFKWKIGVDAIAEELAIFKLLVVSLPNSAKLRLDANGGLSYTDAKLWLDTCDNLTSNIEFIEQPLPVNQFVEMQELTRCYQTPIALDESVATLTQLKYYYQQGWPGIYVIKPGIFGSPYRLRLFCQQNKIDAVFSSVFETAIGRQAALQLAVELSPKNRAFGFGIDHFLAPETANWLDSLWHNL